MKIITNHKFREFLFGCEIADKKVRDEFDWMSDEDFKEASFIRYRKNWYALSEFLCVQNEATGDFAGWDGYMSDTFYSGVLIKFSSDNEFVKVATFYC
jgi:hypothetical protein